MALFPHLDSVDVLDVRRVGATIRIEARPRGERASCPRCAGEARRVHSRYRRQLADTAIGGYPVLIDIRVRRFFCDTTDCAAKTFTEQISGLTLPWSRRTPAAAAMIEAIGLAVAGRAGARLANQLGVAVGRDTVLRTVRAIPDRPVEEVPVLGIDDFALRRGHVYGTVVIDMTTRTPIDLLPDRTADTVATWLRGRPEVQIVCRDRAGAYADGIGTGAPEATQVADRWHLWHNLVGAVEKTVIRHRADLHTPTETTVVGPNRTTPPPSTGPVENRIVTRTIERHAAVHELLTQGRTLSDVSRILELDPKTVRRFARASDAHALISTARKGRSILDQYAPYLRERIDGGCLDAARLTREITALGYRGSAKTVARFVYPLRDAAAPAPPRPAAPSVRQVTGWLTRHPDRLTDEDRTGRQALLTRSPALATTCRLVRDFAEIMVGRRGHKVQEWIARARRDGAPALRSFAAGLLRDLDAVTAGLTMAYSSGPVEGHVNRIKMLKRQMDGRANFDLLRKRVVHYV
ncbi:ISL3 family transposase [Rhodococcus rhodochrous]|uniref:ISL3 family transposase n=1 Tax=Rhodococcus rhodochrous TaxID=1829 RepID=A0AA46X1E3_RHORH|nr:ISL3 family transposase [Rhodococcus rhodochrous]UZF48341.1 ISL3 family transposase [Rhodococcus rhodochrous]